MAEPKLIRARRPPRERFDKKVRKAGPNDCWLWTGGRFTETGYGSFRIDDRMTTAHRAAWILTNGPIPTGPGYHGTCVLHRCDTRLCVNPAHLFLGSNTDNISDRDKKGRTPWGETHSAAKLTEKDVNEIRKSHDTQASLARRFGVSQANISSIRSGNSWRHLGSESSDKPDIHGIPATTS